MGQFRGALDHCCLMEIALHNRKYTWSNEHDNPTMVHLDRVFCNAEWESLFPMVSLQALSSSMSDHCPLFLTNKSTPLRPATFKFETFWNRVPGYKETMQQVWAQMVADRSPMMILNNKLTNVVKALRSWSQSLFGDAKMQLNMTNEIILQLDMAQEERQLSVDEVQLRKDLKMRVLGLAAVERARRQQCSCIKGYAKVTPLQNFPTSRQMQGNARH